MSYCNVIRVTLGFLRDELRNAPDCYKTSELSDPLSDYVYLNLSYIYIFKNLNALDHE